MDFSCKKKNTLKHWEPGGAMMLGIMGDRGWSSWAVEHLSGEHVADNIAYGSSGWWKWITNKHKSGKLQASAPELPQLRKTIRHRQLHRGGGGGKPTGSHMSTETELRCPLRSTELIYCSSVSIFAPPPSAAIKVVPLTALSQRNDTKISSFWGMLHEGPDSGFHRVG